MIAALMLSCIYSRRVGGLPGIGPNGARDPIDAIKLQALTWGTPGGNAAGSVPIGNGSLGANVWVEESGDLLLLLSHTDSFSEAERLLKLGRVRISFDPPIDVNSGFVQRLRVDNGSIEVSAGGVDLVIFAAIDSPQILVDSKSSTPRRVMATTEIWRTAVHRLEGEELKSAWLMRDAPPSIEVTESADVVVDDPGCVTWYHRNEWSFVPITLKHQGLEAVAHSVKDPLIGRTFGGRMRGEGFSKVGPTAIAQDAPALHSRIAITADCSQAESAAAWLARLDRDEAKAMAFDEALNHTTAWWNAHWRASHVMMSIPPARPLENFHPMRVGFDSAGGNTFDGEIEEVRVIPGAKQEQAVIAQNRLRESGSQGTVIATCNGSTWKPSHELTSSGEFIIEAAITPRRDGQTARIFDKATAGGSDGVVLDLQHGRLRAIVGARILQTDATVPVNTRSRVVLVHRPMQWGYTRIYLDGELVGEMPSESGDAPTLTQAYTLQRFVTLAASAGEFPIKFNGSIFTIAPEPINGRPFNEDWRAWGGDFWWQNTRLIYHGMLARGDGDAMKHLFEFYWRALPICRERARLYHGAEGAYFPETITTFGCYGNGDYGWDRTDRPSNQVDCQYFQWAWNQGPELVAMMLDHWDSTRDRSYLELRTIPMAAEVLSYFDSRFARDSSGKLIISPTQAVETYWHGVVNDMPTVAGIAEISRRLCELPPGIGTPQDRELWQRMSDACPALPTMVDGASGATCYAPAQQFDPRRSNCENPNLYAIWPFNHAGVNRGNLEIGRASFEARIEHFDCGWPQDGQQAARLGLAQDAARNVAAKLANRNPACRFPAFWGPNFDWVPDQCQGGNLMTTVQEMLLQSVGEKIIICPALPHDWEGSFRLRAAGNTTVTAWIRGGKIASYQVEPYSRRSDVVLGEGWQLAE